MAGERAPEAAARMVAYLEAKIHGGEFPAGERVPTVRELMERFDMSCGSVKRGLDYLSRKGLIETLSGKGTFVKAIRSDAAVGDDRRTRIAVLMTREISDLSLGIYATAFLGIQEAARVADATLTLVRVAVSDIGPEWLASRPGDADGAIFLGEYDRTLPRLETAFPCVGVCCHRSLGGALSIVDIDPLDSAALAVGFFEAKGVRRVVTISSDAPAYVNRGEAFLSLWKARGGEGELMSPSPDFRPLPDTGYLFTTGSTPQYMSEKLLKETGRTLAEQATVLAIDGKSLIDPAYHACPCVALDWRLIGETAVEECARRVNHPGAPARRIYLPGKLKTLPN